uniref:Lipase_3 domain-containing protein n=1 Tax=Parastrongyloides trichosuri TaxID=131310 RepID=A0A0N4ZK28_PARTI
MIFNLCILKIFLLCTSIISAVKFSINFNSDESDKLRSLIGAVSFPKDIECSKRNVNKYFEVLQVDEKNEELLDAQFKTIYAKYKDNDHTLIVIHRGSKDDVQIRRQFFSAMNPMKKYNNYGSIWDYPYYSFNSIKSKCSSRIKEMKFKHFTKFIFIGCSLGGNLAALDALNCFDLKICTQFNTKVISFGSPKIGDLFFVGAYNSRIPNTYRIAFRDDLIRIFPFDLKYYSIGKAIFLQDERYNICTPDNDDPICHSEESMWQQISNGLSAFQKHLKLHGEYCDNRCE